MSSLFDPSPAPFWHMITRLGEAQVMLPAAFATLAWLALRPSGRPLVGWWLVTMTVAVVITTATKIAFIGYGWGLASIDFTGISGHAMFAAVVYPLLARVLTAAQPASRQRVAVGTAYLLALLIGISRLKVSAHSGSEVVAGLALGGAASAAVLWLARAPTLQLPLWLPLSVGLSLLALGGAAPPSRTHDMVTRIALTLSGRTVPYTRHDLLRPPLGIEHPPLRRRLELLAPAPH